jgi:hypothetical protein
MRPLVLFLFLSLGGCFFHADRARVADSTLVMVLVELHLAEARATVGPYNTLVPRDSILHQHGIDATSFRETMAYYAKRPEAFVALYDRVLDRLYAESHLEDPYAP